MESVHKAIEARAVPKPGPYKKKKRPKQKPPIEKHCRRCSRRTYKERWCHSESRIIKGGTGIMGGKIPDDQTAWLCFDCDLIMSKSLPNQAPQSKFKAHAKEWKRLIDLSH